MPDSRSTSNYKAEHPRPAAAQAKAGKDDETVSPEANERRKEKFDELLQEGDREPAGGDHEARDHHQ